jgi:hypothetical protein
VCMGGVEEGGRKGSMSGDLVDEGGAMRIGGHHGRLQNLIGRAGARLMGKDRV